MNTITVLRGIYALRLALVYVVLIEHAANAIAVNALVALPEQVESPQPLANALEHHEPSLTNATVENRATPGFNGDNLPVRLPRSRIHRRANKIKQPKPASADDFAKAAAKGCNFLYMLRASSAEALIRMKQNPALAALTDSQSSWTNAGALTRYGWTEKKDNVNWPFLGIKEVMDELKIDWTDDKANLNVQLLQDEAVTVDGTAYAASTAKYIQAINVAAGLVIPYHIYSPAHEAKTHNIPGKLVPLAQYSDALFLEYSKLAGRAKVEVKGLKYMLFHNVENVDTWGIVLTALQRKNGKTDLPDWPGVEMMMTEDEGKALLGTPIGAPLAWLLVQHKAAFGAKIVVKVRAFRNKGMANRDTDQPYPSLLFYLDDAAATADPNVHCGAGNKCCCEGA